MMELVERVDHNDRVLGVVDRARAVANGWLIRIATTVCRDRQGRYLVYRRPDHARWFAGYHEVSFGGGVGVGEPYAAAAAREVAEELGVTAPVRPLFTFLCRGAIGSYWLRVHEAVIDEPVAPAPAEVAWFGWLTPAELDEAARQWRFVPDGQEVLRRYRRATGS